jgi:uncharacterized protein YbcI
MARIDDLSPHEPAAPAADPLSQICGEVALAVRRVWGRGPIKATAHTAGKNMLVVLLEDGHTSHEHSLRVAGRTEQLLEGRKALHDILAEDLTAIVAQATGRDVLTMLSATRIDPDVTAAIFILDSSAPAPRHESDSAERQQIRDSAREARGDARALGAQAAQARRKLAEIIEYTDRGRSRARPPEAR